MQRFKNILLVFDPQGRNQAALERAVALAKKNEAQLTVVKVVRKGPYDSSTAEAMSPEDVQQVVVEAGQEQLRELLAPVREDGIRVGAKVFAGTPFLEITRAVLREKHDLVMMTARGEGGLKSRLFGSTSLHLMRKCPCPIWVIKPTQSNRFERILAAVDTDPDDLNEEKDALNTKIMELAVSLAQLERAELHIVHAWSMFAEQLLRAKVSESQVDEWVREDKERHKRQLEALVGRYSSEDVNHKVHLVKGKPESLIPEIAREKQVDLIVMGTVCRTGIAGFLIGTTAERTLQHVDCSVLTVKPKGFVSPVGHHESVPY